MAYKILRIGGVDKGFGEEGIILNEIFSVERIDTDLFSVREECDGWFTKKLTREELLLMIAELKNWVEENDN